MNRHEGASTTRTILVVDDDPVARGLWSRILADEGYTVSAAQDLKEAVRLVDSGRVVLVISDFDSRRIDGFALVEHVKHHHAHIPIVLVAGHTKADAAVRAKLVGATHYLNKPLRIDDLVGLISPLMAPLSAQR